MGLFSFLFRRGRHKKRDKAAAAAAAAVGVSTKSTLTASVGGRGTSSKLRGDSPTQPVTEEPHEVVVLKNVKLPGNTASRRSQQQQQKHPQLILKTPAKTLSPPTSPRGGTSPPPPATGLSPRSTGPVDLDEVDSDNTDDHDDRNDRPMFRLAEDTRFSAGNVPTHDDDAGSEEDGDGSTFNLSTDAEDVEYESMRRRLGVGVGAPPPLDSLSLATEEDRSVFANLASEDDFTANSATKDAAAHSLLHFNPKTGAALVPDSTIPSPNNNNNKAEPQPPPQRKREFTTPKPLPPKEFTTTTTIMNKPQPKKENIETTTMSRPMNGTFASPKNTAPFGDFSPDPGFDGFEFPFSSPTSSPSKLKKLALSTKDAPDTRRRKAYSSQFGYDTSSPGKQQRDPTGFDDTFSSDGWATFVEPKPQASPVAPTKPVVSVANETKLEELLTQAKSKSRRVSTSINSAPALSASYLRQQHGLGGPRKETTSVTDIISSLEAANASRPSRSSSRSLSGSRHIRSPSEGARSRRSQSRQRHVATTNANTAPNSDSEDEGTEEQKDQDNWLFDEVTGALGPRGIAADLDSLSGRSNRSQRSARSGKSARSGRSRRSHSRHGNDSVDSRRSRYSTKSYISQMSEQSRSVAADLLRLERQLAMVGANERPHRPTTRRARITVTAPPGKLGIILANKADAKGTVVSGVRTSSALADQIAPGDRIVAIDGEDVSLMTVSEITSIMARKNEYERTLTVLTTPR